MSINIRHDTNDISTNAGAKVTSGGNTVITTTDAATDVTSGIVELATSAEVQTGTDTGRVPSVSSLRGGLLVSGTAIATTSGTSHDFTGIPSWVKKITIMLSGVSTNGTSVPLIQIGDSGGIENTGYLGASTTAVNVVATANYTTGFGIGQSHAATDTDHGTITLTLLNASTNTWTAYGVIGLSDIAAMKYTAGSKSLSATLDRVRLTTVNGTDAFDAGSINIIYE